MEIEQKKKKKKRRFLFEGGEKKLIAEGRLKNLTRRISAIERENDGRDKNIKRNKNDIYI